MALVIEDGTIVAGANSFVTRAEIIAYAVARGTVLPNEDSTDVLAIQAMDYFRTLCFRGDLVDPAQTTPFPRSGLEDGDTADDWVYSIPQQIKVAQMQLALNAGRGLQLLDAQGTGQRLKRRKTGPMEREYFAPGEGDQADRIRDPLVDAMLQDFICTGALLTTVRK